MVFEIEQNFARKRGNALRILFEFCVPPHAKLGRRALRELRNNNDVGKAVGRVSAAFGAEIC